ncbi:MAG: hypothetical protein AAFN79_09910 [Pseudomonadota bacterium]
MKRIAKAAALIAACALVSACVAGAVVDTTASVVGGAVDGVIGAAEWTADLIVD